MSATEKALSGATANAMELRRERDRLDRWLLRTVRLVTECADMIQRGADDVVLMRQIARDLRAVAADANWHGRRIDPLTKRRRKGKR